MSNVAPTIDFRRIRDYDGTQSGGFEQLAVELFARAHALSRQLVRVNGTGGDGGVEAYAEVDQKGKLGMQAKFFEKLGTSQWNQIDKSVKTALFQHPDLKEYHIYVPLDRTPGRRGKKPVKGQIEKWHQLTRNWQKLPNGSDVAFVWHGRFEIELALKRTHNRDQLFYWFGTEQFEDSWLDRLLNASLQTLNERYQPNRHVNANAARELDRFVRSPSSENILETAFVKCAEACLTFTKTLDRLTAPAGGKDFSAEIRPVMDEVVRTEYPIYGKRRVDEVRKPAQTLMDCVDELNLFLLTQGRSSNSQRDEYQQYSVDTFARAVRDWLDCLELYRDADHQFTLVRGDAGTGKSHLLAHCAVQAMARRQPVLLVLGEQFLDGTAPRVQLGELIGWNGGPESLLSALNVAGSLAARPALLFIDALNESTHRRLWKGKLHALVAEVQKYPHVRLIVSCRSDFVGITMPSDFKSGVPAGWGLIQHYGFVDVLAEAVARYFASYNIRSSHFPPLLDEFRNPLFLDTFCRAFEHQSLPPGPITLEKVMERRITRLAEKLQQDIDCDKHHVRMAIQALAEKIRANDGLAVEEKVARAAIEPHSPSTERSRSLYGHLLSNGVVVERIDRYWEDNPTVMVRFAFERFSDYFIARGLLNDVGDLTALRDMIQEGARLGWMRTCDGYLDNRGVASALAVLVPELHGAELVDLLPAGIEHRGDVLADMLNSLPWRSGSSITDSTKNLLFEASRYGPPGSFIEALLRLSTIPDHPFNAHFLHDLLAARALPQRDAIWTIPVAQLAAGRDTVPSTLVEWAIQVPRDLVSDDQAALVATTLLWFGSSNRVAFRSRAGLAAIRLLLGRPHVMRQLVEKFDAVNDPYVVERLYAVACGVAMREAAGEGLRMLAKTVHKLVFATDDVRPHLLLRDYAQTLLETAAHRNCVDASIVPQSFRPPFASKMPRIIGEKAAGKIAEDEKWGRIAWSVRPEGMGMYGDFGRYIMGSAVHNFLKTSRLQPMPAEPSRNQFDDRLARRWVLQRVKGLGWTGGLFGEYDDRRSDDRNTHDEHKVERIGKKYQWIALHELLGWVSDHYRMRPDWGSGSRSYQGAWQFYQRDFDPSAEPSPRQNVDAEMEENLQVTAQAVSARWRYVKPYADPFVDRELLSDRASWVKSEPGAPIHLLSAMQTNEARQWYVIDGFWTWKEPRILRLRHGWEGRCEMWIHTRSWLIKRGDVDGFLERIRRVHLWGHGIQGVSLGEGWVGEYPHGAVFEEARHWCEQPDELTGNDKAAHVRTACDWDGQGGAVVPSPQLCDVLQLRWSGRHAAFVDPAGVEIATSAALPGASDTAPCVVDAARLQEGLTRSGLEIVWGIVGERHCWNGEKMVGNVETQFSGVYRLSDDGIVGGLTVVKHVELPLPGSASVPRPGDFGSMVDDSPRREDDA